jgi:hypothetical protein
VIGIKGLTSIMVSAKESEEVLVVEGIGTREEGLSVAVAATTAFARSN